MAASPDTYINPLYNPIKKYARVTSLMILTHIWTTYGIITFKELYDYYTRMNAQWNPPNTIWLLLNQLK